MLAFVVIEESMRTPVLRTGMLSLQETYRIRLSSIPSRFLYINLFKYSNQQSGLN